MDEQDVRQGTGRRRSGRIWAGLLLLLIGGVLLLDQMNFPLPDFLFNWHVLLIVIGLFIGLRHNFRGGGWLILMAVGGFFMIQDYYPDTHIGRFIWPGVLILVGLMVMLRPNRSSWHSRWGQEWREDWYRSRKNWHRHGRFVVPDPMASTSSTQSTGGSEDFVDATSIFSGVHKKVMSKNFKGGDITTFMGGTEIDLTQADFTGTVRLDVTQIMGGTKIIVPPHWEVRSEVTALFAGFEDKRQQPAIANPDKVLIIDGTSIFGGIELKNF
jgi:predicted membrane protein